MRSKAVAIGAAILILVAVAADTPPVVAASAGTPAILLEGTVVTMNASRDVITNGRVLVRDGRIAAIWKGGKVPKGVNLSGAVRTPLSKDAVIYPGLINLHDHPFFDMLAHLATAVVPSAAGVRAAAWHRALCEPVSVELWPHASAGNAAAHHESIDDDDTGERTRPRRSR